MVKSDKNVKCTIFCCINLFLKIMWNAYCVVVVPFPSYSVEPNLKLLFGVRIYSGTSKVIEH